ncbi:hypothetical protein Pelo_11162 [Pelomyxa schiedti]|nr:hypothetical protein Pelo_11162 [Pelomyxa schiedti]
MHAFETIQFQAFQQSQLHFPVRILFDLSQAVIDTINTGSSFVRIFDLQEQVALATAAKFYTGYPLPLTSSSVITEEEHNQRVFVASDFLSQFAPNCPERPSQDMSHTVGNSLTFKYDAIVSMLKLRLDSLYQTVYQQCPVPPPCRTLPSSTVCEITHKCKYNISHSGTHACGHWVSNICRFCGHKYHSPCKARGSGELAIDDCKRCCLHTCPHARACTEPRDNAHSQHIAKLCCCASLCTFHGKQCLRTVSDSHGIPSECICKECCRIKCVCGGRCILSSSILGHQHSCGSVREKQCWACGMIESQVCGTQLKCCCSTHTSLAPPSVQTLVEDTHYCRSYVTTSCSVPGCTSRGTQCELITPTTPEDKPLQLAAEMKSSKTNIPATTDHTPFVKCAPTIVTVMNTEATIGFSKSPLHTEPKTPGPPKTTAPKHSKRTTSPKMKLRKLVASPYLLLATHTSAHCHLL